MDKLKQLQEDMKKFVTDRNWTKYHNPKNLAMSISIEAAELMEIYQWMDQKEAKEKSLHNNEVREALKDEIADVIIYCLSLANSTKIDLIKSIEDKMKRNNERFPIGKDIS